MGKVGKKKTKKSRELLDQSTTAVVALGWLRLGGELTLGGRQTEGESLQSPPAGGRLRTPPGLPSGPQSHPNCFSKILDFVREWTTPSLVLSICKPPFL